MKFQEQKGGRTNIQLLFLAFLPTPIKSSPASSILPGSGNLRTKTIPSPWHFSESSACRFNWPGEVGSPPRYHIDIAPNNLQEPIAKLFGSQPFSLQRHVRSGQKRGRRLFPYSVVQDNDGFEAGLHNEDIKSFGSLLFGRCHSAISP